jgi:hypothetical protein
VSLELLPAGSECRFALHAESYRVDVACVGRRRTVGFQRGRPSDLRGGGQRAVDLLALMRSHDRHAVGCEQSRSFGPRQPCFLALAPIQTGVDQLAGGGWVEVLVVGVLSDRPREPFAALRRAGENVCTVFGEAVVRHVRAAAAGRQLTLGGHDARHDGLALRGGGLRDRVENALGIATERIDIEGHQRVDGRVLQEFADAPLVIRRARANAHHEWVLHQSFGLRDEQASVCAGIGRERRDPGGIGDYGDLAPGRQRLAVIELGGVKQLFPGSEPLHPAVMKQRVDDRVPAQRGAGVRARVAARRIKAAVSLDGENRLAGRDPPRDSREPLRVAERLCVEHHHGRARVLLPELEQVVGRDIRAAAKRSEARNP